MKIFLMFWLIGFTAIAPVRGDGEKVKTKIKETWQASKEYAAEKSTKIEKKVQSGLKKAQDKVEKAAQKVKEKLN